MDDESGDAAAIARFQDRMAHVVRRAVLAEREACAQIADDCQLKLIAPITTEAGQHYEGGVNDASDSIATAIRNRQ